MSLSLPVSLLVRLGEMRVPSGRLRIKIAFYVGLFMGVFGGGRVYTGSLFPSGADLLALYLGTLATPLLWGAGLALIAWVTTVVWP